MPTSAKKKKLEVREVQVNPNLPTLFVDSLNIAVRQDGFLLVRFLSELPEGLSEQNRVIIPREKAKEMINVLCRAINHYPEKPKEKNKSSH